MRQPKLNLKSFLPFFMMIVVIAAMIFSTSPQQVSAWSPTPTPEEEPRIVGGAPATPGEWPWQVALVHGGVVNLYNGQFCGGSLIDRQWVLTAGHCVTENDGSVTPLTGLDVVAGIHNLSSGVGYQRRDAVEIIRHPSYNDSTLDNDIALIRLSSPPITLGGSGETTTALVTLAPASSGSFVNSYSWVTGWGREDPTENEYPTELLEVNIPIISNSVCSVVWGGINQGNICAGVGDGKDSCSGDSGGPLVVNLSGTWTLVGVVSSGSGTCGSMPGIYTRVSEYTNWVKSITVHYVASITRQNTNPTNTTSVKFLVTFPVAVTGVDATDFTLIEDLSGTPVITDVSGSGTTYVVTVSVGAGSGTIRLDLVDDDSILNSYSSPLGGTDAGNGDFTSGEAYTIQVVSNLKAPALRSPATKAVLNVTEPSFQWTKIIGAKNYQIEFDNDSNFSSLHPNSTTGITGTSLMVGSAFAEGEYFWRVRANNSSDQPGKWSLVRSFTIDTTSPAEPAQLSPADAFSTTRHVVTFMWDPSPSAVLYQFVYSVNPDCSDPAYSKTTNKTSIRPPAIPNGTYYWCVGAKDAAGNWSGLQITPFSFEIEP